MTQSSKIVFFGNERLSSGFDPQGAPTLELLVKNGYDVAAVVANFEQSMSRGARTLEIKEIAEKYHIPLLLPTKLGDITDKLASIGAAAGVLVAYGKIIPQRIIDLFPRGIINIHPSLLPHYRGSTPIEQAIIDGAQETGVSLMRLVAKMDAGPIFAQTKVPLRGNETKQELTSKLLNIGGQMLIANLPHILDGTAKITEQNESNATFTSLFTKDDGKLDLAKTAQQLEREIRALAGWPKARATIFGHEVIILSARVAGGQTDGALVIPCGENTFLEVLQLTAPSGRTMSGADFLRGYKK
jgi:methionyl-tRNA formyltransferase